MFRIGYSLSPGGTFLNELEIKGTLDTGNADTFINLFEKPIRRITEPASLETADGLR